MKKILILVWLSGFDRGKETVAVFLFLFQPFHLLVIYILLLLKKEPELQDSLPLINTNNDREEQ